MTWAREAASSLVPSVSTLIPEVSFAEAEAFALQAAARCDGCALKEVLAMAGVDVLLINDHAYRIGVTS